MSRVDPLIDAYFDDELTPEQAEHLCLWVKASPEHALLFARRSLLHGLTRQHMAAQDVWPFAMGVAAEDVDDLADDMPATPPPSIDIDLIFDEVRKHVAESRRRAAPTDTLEAAPAPTQAGRSKRRSVTARHIVIPRLVAYGVPAAVAAMVLLFWMLTTSDRQSPVESSTTGTMVAATVDAAWDARWDQTTPLETGAQLLAGMRFTLEEGIVELTMRRGTTVVLEAPCIVEVHDDNALRLDRGKLTAQVPPSASRFAVHTPVMRIVDLGTEFGVVAEEGGQVEVHVFTGEVVLHSPDASLEPKQLSKGQAVRIDGRTRAVQSFEADESAFARSMAQQQRDGMRRHMELIRSAAPIAYWRFATLAQGFVPNEMSARYRAVAIGNVRVTNATLHPSIVLGEGGEGFMIESITELREADAYAIECWFNPREAHHGVLLRLVGGFRIELTGDRADGEQPARAVRFIPHPSSDAVASSTPYEVDQWQHVVVTKEGSEIRLYLNGHLVQSAKDSRRLPATIHALHLGMDRSARGDTSRFRGRMDEMAIYRHALSAEQVAQHYHSWMNEQIRSRQ